MDREIQECLLYIQQNASEIRHKGKHWRMSDAEISSCVAKAMKVKITDLSNELSEELSPAVVAAKFKTRKVWNRIRRVGKCTMLLTAMLLLLGATVAAVLWCQGKPLSMMTPSRLLHPYAYQIMRVVRLAGYRLHKLSTSIEDYYDSECIVFNPLWRKPGGIDCELCESVKTVHKLNNKVEVFKFDEYYYPLIHEDLMRRIVLLEDITSHIQHSKVELLGSVTSSVNWSRTASDFANNASHDKISKSHSFQFHWKSLTNLLVGRLMRTIFPKPHIFEQDLEVSLEKFLYVDGPNTTGYKLDEFSEPGFSWYCQGSGVRTVEFSPVNKSCTELCHSFQIVVQQRDVLTFPNGIWDVAALENGDNVSISYLGHVLSTL